MQQLWNSDGVKFSACKRDTNKGQDEISRELYTGTWEFRSNMQEWNNPDNNWEEKLRNIWYWFVLYSVIKAVTFISLLYSSVRHLFLIYVWWDKFRLGGISSMDSWAVYPLMQMGFIVCLLYVCSAFLDVFHMTVYCWNLLIQIILPFYIYLSAINWMFVFPQNTYVEILKPRWWY